MSGEQMMLPLLTLASSRSDLPVSWDGVPVEWSEWSGPARTTIILHAPPKSLACDQCGAVDEPLIAFGKRPVPEGKTYSGTRTKTTKSGKQYSVVEERPAWPVRDLIAARCRDCGHDVITDQRTGQRWDLDESDYGPGGSSEPQNA